MLGQVHGDKDLLQDGNLLHLRRSTADQAGGTGGRFHSSSRAPGYPPRLMACFSLKATALIVGLAGERTRWTQDSRKFADIKRRLVGDVALSCAFVGYCGPFNQEFRNHLLRTR